MISGVINHKLMLREHVKCLNPHSYLPARATFMKPRKEATGVQAGLVKVSENAMSGIQLLYVVKY